ncbi:MAG: DUF456 domain-containing protein [Candidatus Moraniibacteriota bacterium]
MSALIVIGLILVLLGIAGSILPFLPGPILSFTGLFLLFLDQGISEVSSGIILFFGFLLLILILIDYLAPILGARIAGSSKTGIWGAIIGAVAGILFFPPFGILAGAVLGTFAGEYYINSSFKKSIKAVGGVILGGLLVMILQFLYSLIIAVYFVAKLF